MKNELTFNDLPMVVKELCNKAETILQVEKDKADSNISEQWTSNRLLSASTSRRYLKL